MLVRTMGWFGSDIVDWFGDRASDVVDVAGDVLSNVPGADAAYGALKDVVNGPLRDFANTSVGKVVFRAMSTSWYGGIVSVTGMMGAQFASVAFAIPGLFRGQDFESAWFDEMKWRAEKTAEIMGAEVAELFMQQVTDLLPKVIEEVGVNGWVSETAAQLAERYGVREDAAAAVKALVNRTPEVFNHDDYDAATGRRKWLELTDSIRNATIIQFANDYGLRNREAFEIKTDWSKVEAIPFERASGFGVKTDWLALARNEPAPEPVRAVAPPVVPEQPEPSSAGTVALIVALGAAAATGVWFFMGKR